MVKTDGLNYKRKFAIDISTGYGLSLNVVCHGLGLYLGLPIPGLVSFRGNSLPMRMKLDIACRKTSRRVHESGEQDQSDPKTAQTWFTWSFL